MGRRSIGKSIGMTAPTFDRDSLLSLAHKYIWWKSPEDAVVQPERVVAQVMNIGDFEDTRAG